MYFVVLCNVLRVLRNVRGVLCNVLSVLHNVPGDPRNIFLVPRVPKAYCVGALTVGALKKQKRRKKQHLTNLKGRALHWPNYIAAHLLFSQLAELKKGALFFIRLRVSHNTKMF